MARPHMVVYKRDIDGAHLAQQIGRQEFPSSVKVGFSGRSENPTTIVIVIMCHRGPQSFRSNRKGGDLELFDVRA